MSHIVTASYAENEAKGVMICGINFGFSEADEINEANGILSCSEPASFFSDIRVNNTKFRNTILKWFYLWGIPLETDPDSITCFEKSIFQTNWLDTQTRGVSSEGIINAKVLAENSDDFLATLAKRKPSHIIFFSNSLIEALNSSLIRVYVESILGEWPGKANIHKTPLKEYRGVNFKVMTQEYERVKIMSLPHPQSRGLTDIYISSFSDVVKEFLGH